MVKQSEFLATKACRFYNPGLIEYQGALRLQEGLAEKRIAGET